MQLLNFYNITFLLLILSKLVLEYIMSIRIKVKFKKTFPHGKYPC